MGVNNISPSKIDCLKKCFLFLKEIYSVLPRNGNFKEGWESQKKEIINTLRKSDLDCLIPWAEKAATRQELILTVFGIIVNILGERDIFEWLGFKASAIIGWAEVSKWMTRED